MFNQKILNKSTANVHYTENNSTDDSKSCTTIDKNSKMKLILFSKKEETQSISEEEEENATSLTNSHSEEDLTKYLVKLFKLFLTSSTKFYK